VRLGQSVLLLPAPDAEDLVERPRALGAVVTMASITMDRDGIEAFRSRGLRARLA
jgi:hypothetical protein